MFNVTSMYPASSFFQESGTTCNSQVGSDEELRPLEIMPNITSYVDPNSVSDFELTSSQKRSYESPMRVPMLPTVADSIPLQIWEGTVLKFDACVMHVLLNAKMGQVPRHTAEIDLEWVSDQDKDLVRPGAVFYLTLYKRTKRGSIENAQELRFRRRPSWSQGQLKAIEDDSTMLLAKMKALPRAE